MTNLRKKLLLIVGSLSLTMSASIFAAELPKAQSEVSSTITVSPRASKIYTYTDTSLYSTYGVKVKYNLSINVLQDASTGKYYIASLNADLPEITAGSAIASSPSYSTTDGGSTRLVSSKITIQKSGATYTKTSTAYVYVNTSTGAITVQGY